MYKNTTKFIKEINFFGQQLFRSFEGKDYETLFSMFTNVGVGDQLKIAFVYVLFNYSHL